MAYFRDDILAMDGYLPGEQPQAGKFIKLNTNENPYPPSPAVRRAIAAAVDAGLGRYPDPLCTAFRRRAGELLSIDPDSILCGNGSDDILTIVTRALVAQGQCLRMPTPSYILYRSLAQLQARRPRRSPSSATGRCRTPSPSRATTCGWPSCQTRTVPRARCFRPSAVLEIAEGLPCPLLVDEAYVDFADTSCLALVARNEKIMVSRSLSKSYALAGLRFGFLVAQPQLIEQFVKVKDSYNVGSLAIAGATAAIDDQAWLADNRAKILQTRRRLQEGMRRLGFTSIESQANFVWNTHATRNVRELYEKLKAERILVRYMNYQGWGDGLRISVGTDEQIDACLALLARII